MMNERHRISRRSALARLTTVAATGAVPSLLHAEKERSPLVPLDGFRIGACDWSLRKTGDPGALRVAKELGIDGVQASFGAPGGRFDLRKKEAREAYAAASDKYGTVVGSLGIGQLNSVPYKSDPRTEDWVSDSIDAAAAMKLSVVLLAFFGRNDLKGDEKGTKEVIRRLRRVAPKAEKAGVVFGLETWLDADEHLRIIDGVGSPNVQVYYDVGNSKHRGYDIYSEIRRLGRDRICELHAKDYASKLFGHGDIDFWAVRRALDDIGYRGWIHIEGRAPFGLERSYRHDRAFLRAVFPRECPLK